MSYGSFSCRSVAPGLKNSVGRPESYSASYSKNNLQFTAHKKSASFGLINPISEHIKNKHLISNCSYFRRHHFNTIISPVK